jgi:hypothetical protein
MKTPLYLALALTLLAQSSAAGLTDTDEVPGSGPATVEPSLAKTVIQGQITTVRMEPGGGPPILALKDKDGAAWTVLLGAIPFLIREDFKPKTGQKVEVTGIYRTGNHVVAQKITLPETGKTIVLRDEKGYPVWRRGGQPIRGKEE